MSSQTIVFSLVAVLAIGSASLIPAYADTVNLPELSDDNLRGVSVFTTYQSDNRYTVNIQVQYQVGSHLEVPEAITYFSMDGTQIFTIPVQDEFITANTPIIVTSEPELTDEEIKKIEQEQLLEKVRMKIAAEKGQWFDDYITCMDRFEETQPVRYLGWFRTSEIVDYRLPSSIPDDSNLSSHEKEIRKQTQACLHMMNYKDIGPWEANKIIDGLTTHPGLDMSDSPLTVDVTDADILAEAKRAEEMKRHYTNPYKEFDGDNRGNDQLHLEDKSKFCQTTAWEIDASGQLCPMASLIQHNEENKAKSPETINTELQQLLCDEYQYQYTASRHPDWLGHCDFTE